MQHSENHRVDNLFTTREIEQQLQTIEPLAMLPWSPEILAQHLVYSFHERRETT
jgi:hypothetical protein